MACKVAGAVVLFVLLIAQYSSKAVRFIFCKKGKLVIELLRLFRSARQVRPRPHARTNPISIPSHSRRRRHPPLAPAAGIRPATSTAGPPPRRAESAEASASQAPPNLPPTTEDRSLHRTPETILPQAAQFPPVYSSGFPSDVHRPYYLAAGELPADYRYVKSQGDKQLWYKNAAHLTSDCAPETVASHRRLPPTHRPAAIIYLLSYWIAGQPPSATSRLAGQRGRLTLSHRTATAVYLCLVVNCVLEIPSENLLGYSNSAMYPGSCLLNMYFYLVIFIFMALP
ncbi:uncharacterized protein [Triticum aestivum]|uniref:uncharacterized protein n=1 Tax=Triticum aestivum TaxID=4565 RepID=UPI001D035854|nr:uncharacterized protein LOC123115311 [Triticum aestivum]